MMWLEIKGKSLTRAYSIASANHIEEMEFLSIKVSDGKLTPHLQNIKIGDPILLSSKPTGTLTGDHLLPGRHFSLSGTGLAPFMSIIRDPSIYERFDKIIFTHGVRYIWELFCLDIIENELPKNPYFGD